jgi:hypothetical protein
MWPAALGALQAPMNLLPRLSRYPGTSVVGADKRLRE